MQGKKGFTPLESPAIYGGDERCESLIPYRKGRVKAPFFLTGFTLIELSISVSMFIIIMLVAAYVFRSVLISWSSQETRTGLAIGLDRAVEEMSRDLRKARAVQAVNDEIRFRQGVSSYYIYYFYNPNDSYPLAFSQVLYQLKKEALSGGIDGNFTYGAGQPILNDVLAPVTSDLSMSGNLTTIDVSVRRHDETIRARTQVRPRNF